MRQLLWIALVFLPAATSAHEFYSTKVSWTREISRIVFKSCVGCHREGAAAFSLMTYDEARPWAKAIKEEVLGRRMPPWGAVKGFGSFEHDRGLSQDEISLIAEWVEGGAPEGQKTYLPNPPAKQLALKSPKFSEQLLSTLPLRSRLTLVGIAPRGAVAAGAQVTAELPDGSVEPLIWIVDPSAAVKRAFLFREPKSFPVGTRFVVSKSGGLWKLLLSPSPLSSSR